MLLASLQGSMTIRPEFKIIEAEELSQSRSKFWPNSNVAGPLDPDRYAKGNQNVPHGLRHNGWSRYADPFEVISNFEGKIIQTSTRTARGELVARRGPEPGSFYEPYSSWGVPVLRLCGSADFSSIYSYNVEQTVDDFEDPYTTPSGKKQLSHPLIVSSAVDSWEFQDSHACSMQSPEFDDSGNREIGVVFRLLTGWDNIVRLRTHDPNQPLQWYREDGNVHVFVDLYGIDDVMPWHDQSHSLSQAGRLDVQIPSNVSGEVLWEGSSMIHAGLVEGRFEAVIPSSVASEVFSDNAVMHVDVRLENLAGAAIPDFKTGFRHERFYIPSYAPDISVLDLDVDDEGEFLAKLLVTETPGIPVTIEAFWASGRDGDDIIGSAWSGTEIASSGLHEVTFPQSDLSPMPDGARYLHLVADPHNIIAETNEQNNVAQIRVDAPDLSGSLALDLKEVYRGSPLTGVIDLRNIGFSDAHGAVGIRVSIRNESLEQGLGRIDIDIQLPPGGMTAVPFEFVAPPDLPSGDYELVVNLQPSMREVSRENNLLTHEIEILRDPGYVYVLSHGAGSPYQIGGVELSLFGVADEQAEMWQTTLPHAITEAHAEYGDTSASIDFYSSDWPSTNSFVEAMVLRVLSGGMLLVADEMPVALLRSLLSQGAEAMAGLADAHWAKSRAAMEATAREIVRDLTKPVDLGALIPFIGTAEESRAGLSRIHMVGHSRGAALNTRIAELLSQEGFWVDRFTSLDGYGTDWPGGAGLVGDLDIARRLQGVSAEPAEGGVGCRANMQVQDGLETYIPAGLRQFAQDFVQLYGLGSGGIAGAYMDRFFGQVRDSWKAPPRDGMFDVVLASSDQGVATNHLNVTEFFVNSAESGQGVLLDGVLNAGCPGSVGTTSHQRLAEGESQAGFAVAIRDGTFEEAGQVMKVLEEVAQVSFDDPFVSAWAGFIGTADAVLEAFWDFDEGVRLVRAAQGSGHEVEIQPNGSESSLSQVIQLPSTETSISVDVLKTSDGAGEVFLRFGEDEMYAITIDGAVSGTVVVPLTGLESQFGRLSIGYRSDQSDDAIRVDNVAFVDAIASSGFRDVLDVNGDESVSALDALLIINQISRRFYEGANVATTRVDHLLDVNRDGKITALDALLVVNHMARVDAVFSVAEGESKRSVNNPQWRTAFHYDSFDSDLLVLFEDERAHL